MIQYKKQNKTQIVEKTHKQIRITTLVVVVCRVANNSIVCNIEKSYEKENTRNNAKKINSGTDYIGKTILNALTINTMGIHQHQKKEKENHYSFFFANLINKSKKKIVTLVTN